MGECEEVVVRGEGRAGREKEVKTGEDGDGIEGTDLGSLSPSSLTLSLPSGSCPLELPSPLSASHPLIDLSHAHPLTTLVPFHHPCTLTSPSRDLS